MYIERLKCNCKLLDFPIAHKGAFGNDNGKLIPENSMASIKSSIEKRIPFEIDIVQTKDDIPIVYHDFSVSINGKHVAISNLTLEELRYYTKNTLCISTLEECIKINNGTVPMVLDFKETSLFKVTKYRANIIKLLKHYEGEYAIQSFNPFFVLVMGIKLPKAIRGQLICRGKSLIDTFKVENFKSISNLYEKLMSTICWIARADYIGLELSKSKRWNNKIEQFIFNTSDEVQNTVVEFASKVTKKPVIGWTLTDLNELKISPFVFDNYIFEPDTFENYNSFMDDILTNLEKRKKHVS